MLIHVLNILYTLYTVYYTPLICTYMYLYLQNTVVYGGVPKHTQTRDLRLVDNLRYNNYNEPIFRYYY